RGCLPCTVDGLNAGDVVAGQAVFLGRVRAIHCGRRHGTVTQAQGMAELVGGHREQIVSGIDVKRLARVEGDVTGDGVGVGAGGHVGGGQGAGAEVVAADADVAGGEVALLVVAGADGNATVGYDSEVQVGLLRPHLGCLEDLVLPNRRGPL